LWELVCNNKPGRQDNHEITLFDSVGFALEDYSILRVVYELAKQYQLGTELPLIPELNDPKNKHSKKGQKYCQLNCRSAVFILQNHPSPSVFIVPNKSIVLKFPSY
jgi:hypothetical protein